MPDRRRLAALAVCAVLGGVAACAPVGRDDLGDLAAGRTTVAQAIDRLGTPDRDETLADGSRLLTYSGSRARTRPANFVPGLAYVWGGWAVDSAEAALMFTPDGLLRFHTWSSTHQGLIQVVGIDRPPPPPVAPVTPAFGPDPDHAAD